MVLNCIYICRRRLYLFDINKIIVIFSCFYFFMCSCSSMCKLFSCQCLVWKCKQLRTFQLIIIIINNTFVHKQFIGQKWSLKFSTFRYYAKLVLNIVKMHLNIVFFFYFSPWHALHECLHCVYTLNVLVSSRYRTTYTARSVSDNELSYIPLLENIFIVNLHYVQ